MKPILILIAMLTFSQSIFAQSIEVTYGEKKDLSQQLQAISNPQIKAILENLAKEETLYTLQFSNGTSIYNKIESDTKPIENIIRVSNDTYQCYKNQGDGKMIEKNNILNKHFLIDAELICFDWEILEDAESIAGYKVKKAESNIDGEKVLVWFTEDISVNDGPRDYWGLPGLILKVVGQGKTIEAKSIKVLSEHLAIEEPSDGKSITRDQYEMLKSEKEADLISDFGGAEVIKLDMEN